MGALFISLAAGGSITLVVWGIWILNREVVSAGEDAFGAGTESEAALVRILLPYARSAGAVLQGVLPRDPGGAPATGDQLPVSVQARRFLARQLRYAGNPAGLLPEEFLGLMVVGTVLAAGAWTLTALLLSLPSWWVPALGGAALVGFLLPVVWLKDTLAARRKAIRRTLPYAMDLLTLAVEAGLDFTVALGRIVRKIGQGPLGQELGKTLKEVQMGTTRKSALRSLGDRVGMLEVSFLTAALIQADELRSSLGPILRIQGDQMRGLRFMAAEELALKAPVKMIFPLAIFILPITMIVILGPVFIKFLPQMKGVAVQQRQVREGAR